MNYSAVTKLSPRVLSLILGTLFWGLAAIVELPSWFQWGFFGMAVFLVGIPHGAVDHLVQAKASRKQGKAFGMTRFSLRYIFLILLGMLGWLVFPLFSLALFVLISAWHFGKTDLYHHLKATPFAPLIFLLYGLSIILILLVPNLDQVQPILSDLSPESVEIATRFLQQYGEELTLGLAVLAFSFSLYYLKSQADLLPLLQLFLVFLVVWNLSLPLAFGLYFGGIHSLHAYRDIHSFLGSSVNLLKAVLPLSLLAVPGVLLVGWAGQFFMNPLLLIFIFIASLTFPHVGVMELVYPTKAIKNKNASPNSTSIS